MSIRTVINYSGIYDILDTYGDDIEMTEAKYSGSFTDRIMDAKIEMTLLPSHPHYDDLVERVSTIWAYENGVETFHGRPIAIETDVYHRKKLTCECDAKFLEDVPDIYSMAGLADDVKTITFEAAVRKIFTEFNTPAPVTPVNYGYNYYAGDARKIYLGGIDQTLASKEIDKPSNNSVYSNLKSWLEAVEGYAWVQPVQPQGAAKHYEIFFSASRERATDANKFFVRYGENVTDYKLQRGSENYNTAIHAIGKADSATIKLQYSDIGIVESAGYKLWPGAEVTEDCDRVIRSPFANDYGSVIFHEEFDVKDEQNQKQALVDKAVESLEKKMKRYESIDMLVVDPRLLGYDDSYRPILGNSYPIDIPLPRDSDAPPTEILTKIEKDMLNPTKSAGKLTFGDKRNLLSGRNQTAVSTANRASSEAKAAAGTANKANATAETAKTTATAAAETAAQAKQAADAVADYIQETGTSGIWTYEKWASGKAVCRGTAEWTIASGGLASSGNVYSLGTSAVLPSGLFTEIDNVQEHIRSTQISGTDTSVACWAGHYRNTTITNVYYQVFRGSQLTADTTFYVDISVVGKWQ